MSNQILSQMLFEHNFVKLGKSAFCLQCAQGYQRDTEHGCTDIDECVVSRDCGGVLWSY